MTHVDPEALIDLLRTALRFATTVATKIAARKRTASAQQKRKPRNLT
jgi:hypothetical protein